MNDDGLRSIGCKRRGAVGALLAVVGTVLGAAALVAQSRPLESRPGRSRALESRPVITAEPVASFRRPGGMLDLGDYSVSLHADGTLAFQGRQSGPLSSLCLGGRHLGRVSQDEKDAIVMAFLEAGYFDFKDAYDDRRVTDRGFRETSFTHQGRTKRVWRDLGDPSAPAALPDLERLVEGVIPSRWKSPGVSWLSLHQSPDGSWSQEDFANRCDPIDSPGCADEARASSWPVVATTALALIPLASATGGYLGQGNVSRDAAIRGLVLLVEAQLEDGTFGASDPGMNALQQAWAATALCLYRRPTKWEELKFASAAQKAVAALLRMQTRTGSWPGPPGLEDADVVTTGWAALALCAAAQASVEFDHVNLSAAADDLDRCAALLAIPGPQSRPTLGTARALRAAAMAVVARAFVAPEATLASPTEPLLLAIDPKSIPLGELDPATAFFAIRAHQLVAPRRSSAAAGAAFWLRVRDSTCSVGCRSCSWNPSGAWGRAGGRLYSAATGLMCELAYFGSPSLPGRR